MAGSLPPPRGAINPLAAPDTCRIACIGVVTEAEIGRALEAMAGTLAEMGVTATGRAG